MTDEERNGPEETFHDTERKLRARIEQLEADTDEAYARGFSAGQQALKDTGKLVVVDSPELAELRLALTQSRAETAAAYERAAKLLDQRGQEEQINYGLGRETQNFYRARDMVRALATPDQIAALDAVRAEARAQGMREAAEIARNIKGGDGYIEMLVSDAILSAIKGAKA